MEKNFDQKHKKSNPQNTARFVVQRLETLTFDPQNTARFVVQRLETLTFGRSLWRPGGFVPQSGNSDINYLLQLRFQYNDLSASIRISFCNDYNFSI